MTTISNNDIAQAIYQLSKKENSTEHFYQKVIQFLVRRHLLSKSPQILQSLNKTINDDEGKVAAKIFSKEYLSEVTKKELSTLLARHYPGKTVMIDNLLDEKLLGGFKIEINDEVIDLSINNKIRKLKEHLTSNHE